MVKKILFILVPFIIVITIFFALYKGLSFKPEEIPSEFLHKPIPHTHLTDIYQWNAYIDSNNFQPQNSAIGRWYLVNVWASWCEVCHDEHPFLMDLARQGVVIYGFDYKDKPVDAKKWLATYGNPYTASLWDPTGQSSAEWGVYGVPETYLVDPNGIIRLRQAGVFTEKIWTTECLPMIQQSNLPN